MDNELWTLVSALFEKQIRDAIRKAARVDLTGPVAQGKEALHAKLAEMRQTTGVQVDLTNTQISAGPIVAAPSELIAVARFESVANVTVSALP